MDKEQAKTLYEKLPLKIRFSSYFKYSFTFTGENDVLSAILSFGGNADDIYRESVDTDEVEAPATLDDLHGAYNWIRLTEKETGKVYEHYEY